MSANLVRFQLPGNWAVCYNSFGDEDMLVEDGQIRNFYYYKEDLLWLQAMRRAEDEMIAYELDPAGWLVDVGWHPDSDPAGTYALRIFRESDELGHTQHPAFCSRNRQEVVAVLEHFICSVCPLNEPEAVIAQRLAEIQVFCDQGKLAEFLDSVDQR